MIASISRNTVPSMAKSILCWREFKLDEGSNLCSKRDYDLNENLVWCPLKFSRWKKITILLKLISTYCWKLQLRWVMWPTGIFLIYWNKSFMYNFFEKQVCGSFGRGSTWVEISEQQPFASCSEGMHVKHGI